MSDLAQSSTRAAACTQPARRRAWFAGFALAVLASAGGCVLTESNVFNAKSSPAAAQSASKKKVGVEGYTLGELDQPPPSADEFMKSFMDRVNLKSEALAASLLRRYPEAACECLRGGIRSPAPFIASQRGKQSNAPNLHASADLKLLATLVDRRLAQQPGEHGWTKAIESPAFAEFLSLRKTTIEHQHKGMPEQTPFAALTKLAPSLPVPLRIEAHRLQAVSYSACGKTNDAIAQLEKGLALSGPFPLETVHMQLVLSELYHQADKHERAVHLWQQAVERAASMIDGPMPVLDPRFWEQAVTAHPYDVAWPEAACRALQGAVARHYLRTQTLPPLAKVHPAHQGEDLIWMWIGHARLERREGKAALLAFKRAESLSTDAARTERLRLSQAQSLMLLQQSVAAVPFLVSLTKNPSSEVAPAALAALGTMKVSEGMLEQGMALLRQAVDMAPEKDWHGRAAAEADLGLTYIMLSREADGLACLHRAQEQFERDGQIEDLARSLLNEAAYLERIGEALKAQNIRERLATLAS